jgi:mannobiose 2-epimerase
MTSVVQRISGLKPKFLDTLQNNILNFWVTKTIDKENGGFIGLVNDENKPVNSSKGVVLNTRILWTFSAAYAFFRSPEYKLLADRAYHYISEFFLDKKYGGVYWELDFRGKILNPRKQVYAQAFAIYSFTEYFKITQEQEVLDKAIAIHRLIEKYSYDKAKGGYIDAFREDWSEIQDLRLSEKDLNAPKTMNTHIHILEAYTNLYRVWKDESLGISLRTLILLFLEKFLDDRGHLILFFDNDWNRLGDYCSYGHDIEYSWLLTEAASVLGDPDLIADTRKTALGIAGVIVNEGIDTDGGLMNEFDFKKNELDPEKHWWQQAEAMLGFFNAYRISKNEKYLDSLLQVWDFIDKSIIDHQNGEWFWKVDKNGKVCSGMEKAGFWKCPYHNTRAMIELSEQIAAIQ